MIAQYEEISTQETHYSVDFIVNGRFVDGYDFGVDIEGRDALVGELLADEDHPLWKDGASQVKPCERLVETKTYHKTGGARSFRNPLTGHFTGGDRGGR